MPCLTPEAVVARPKCKPQLTQKHAGYCKKCAAPWSQSIFCYHCMSKQCHRSSACLCCAAKNCKYFARKTTPCDTGLKAEEGAHRKVVTSSFSRGISQPLGFKTWEESRDLQSLANQYGGMGTCPPKAFPSWQSLLLTIFWGPLQRKGRKLGAK